MNNEIDPLSTNTKHLWETRIIRKYGSLEAYREEAHEWRSRGGKKGGGFGHMTPEQRSEAGKKGYAARVDKLRKEIKAEMEGE